MSMIQYMARILVEEIKWEWEPVDSQNMADFVNVTVWRMSNQASSR
jgi:hypothetical protein